MQNVKVDKWLYGNSTDERIVSAECEKISENEVAEQGACQIITWQRNIDGTTSSSRHVFRPWLVHNQRFELKGAEWSELDGGYYCQLATFSDWNDFMNARRILRDKQEEPLCYTTPSAQYLMQSGITLFKGMAFNDVVRLQLDIETAGLDARVDDNNLIMIALSDNKGFEKALVGTEADMLDELMEIIRQRDPDVIEGHNIFGFDLPYMMTRAEKLGIALQLGRDGSPATYGYKRNYAVGGYTRPFTPVNIYGRHVVDTYLAVQRFDSAKGEMKSYGLKEVAKHLGIAEPERIILDRVNISVTYKTDPQLVEEYALQDVRETRRLAEIVLPTDFYQTQMLPDNYQQISFMGMGEKINRLLIRAYLSEGKGLPQPLYSENSNQGGYTEVRRTGVIKPVVKCDVESLYPSVMLNYSIAPRSDSLGVFLPLLQELLERRLSAKAKSKQTTGVEAEYWDGIQGSFKVLINSFYGYLGAPFHFNDPPAAARVTEVGRDIVKQIAKELEKRSASVIEIDTDGVYFSPPSSVQDYDAESAFIASISAELPQGIRLAHDGRYAAMVSLKIKNYALYTYDDKLIMKGAALRSRTDEPFGRQFIESAVLDLLKGNYEALKTRYLNRMRDIHMGKMSITELARTERITDKTFSSALKRKYNEIAQKHNLKSGDYIVIYQRKDGVYAMAEAYNNDEDREYYMDKLYKFALRLKDAFDNSSITFESCIPPPNSPEVRKLVQPTLDLFDE